MFRKLCHLTKKVCSRNVKSSSMFRRRPEIELLEGRTLPSNIALHRALGIVLVSLVLNAAHVRAQPVTGTGTSGQVPLWTGPSPTSAIGNSVITQAPTGLVGVGTGSPAGQLHVASGGGWGSPQMRITQNTADDYARLRFDSFGTEPDSHMPVPWPYWDIAAGDGVLNIYEPSFGNVMTFASGLGRVGIGTTNPNATLHVNGSFVVTGGSKSALVETASYGKRLLYAVESPQNWFEDFGSAKMVHGRAVVKLDPVFSETVNTNLTTFS